MAAKLKLASHIVEMVDGEQTVLMNLRTGSYLGVNATGGRILRALKEGRSMEHIAEEIVLATGAPAARVKADVEAYVAELVAADVVVAS